MADFLTSYNLIMKHEGLYSNNSNDRGGETYSGISRVNNPKWEGWAIVDSMKKDKNFPKCLNTIEKLETLKKEFYKNNYWDIFMGDSIKSQNIANKLLDISINMGISTSIKYLQKSLNILNRNEKDYYNVKEDGIFGNETLKTLNNHPQNFEYIYKILNILQGYHYINISERNETQENFLRGWLNRINIDEFA